MPIAHMPMAQPRLQLLLRPFDCEKLHPVAPGPAAPTTLTVRAVCRIVTRITAEMVMIAGSRALQGRDRRRMLCHVRQISMYVCHTMLQLTQPDIAGAFGRHRATVAHACAVVEDRRDNAAFDDFVGAVERTADAVFRFAEVGADD